jgi:outer membrane lipoprotein SlyB
VKSSSSLIGLLAASLILGGCASSMSGSSYTRSQARKEETVRHGTVQSVRAVTIEGTKTPIGALAGAGVGGIAGSTIGHNSGSAIAAIIGGVAGGLAGAAAEEAITREPGLEIIVRLDNGNTVAITQKADRNFRPGERVYVISGGGAARVAPVVD